MMRNFAQVPALHALTRMRSNTLTAAGKDSDKIFRKMHTNTVQSIMHHV